MYKIIEQTHDGQSAAKIAERALVSEPTAHRHCKSLVNTGLTETEQNNQTTLHKRNSDWMLMSRIRGLREEATQSGLLDSTQGMKVEIRHYENRYDAVSPEEFAQQLDTDETGGWNDLTA